jgi:hypothetical protein
MSEAWHDGSCYWWRGPNNRIRNNVASNCATWGTSYMIMGGTSGPLSVPLPAAQGQVPSGNFLLNEMGIREDAGNEAYATDAGALTLWNVGASCCVDAFENPGSTFLNWKAWAIRGREVMYGYGENRVTFDGWSIYADAALLFNDSRQIAFYFGDYTARHLIIRNTIIEGVLHCLIAPLKAGDTRDIYGTQAGTTLFEDSTCRAYWGVEASTQYGVTGGGTAIPPRLVTIRNVTFGRVPGGDFLSRPQADIGHYLIMVTNPNIIVSDRIIVEQPSGMFEVFALEQAPNFVIPSTVLTQNAAGLTNQQAMARFGIAIHGQVAPCSDTREGIIGFVCPITRSPSPAAAAPPASYVRQTPSANGPASLPAGHGHDRAGSTDSVWIVWPLALALIGLAGRAWLSAVRTRSRTVH